MHWYYSFLVRRPYLMVVAIAVLCSACIIVSLTLNKWPDFSDPTLGFESRGTDIGKRLISWHNLMDETDSLGTLVANPDDLERNRLWNEGNFSMSRKKKQRNKNHKHKDKGKRKKQQHKQNAIVLYAKQKTRIKQPNDSPDENVDDLEAQRLPSQWNGDSGIFRDYEITNDTWSSVEQSNRSEHFEYGRNMTSMDEELHRERIQTKKSTWRILKQAAAPSAWDDGASIPIGGYFCDSPSKEYSHFVVERTGPNATDTLFDLNGFLAMCQLQEQITAISNYEEYCHKEMLTDACCRPWSLPSYAALLANKSSCFSLTHDDISTLQNLLVSCYEYFHDLKLSNDCSSYNRCYAPPECTRNNVVFNVLHFLADSNFIKINDSNIYLKYAMIFIPVAHTTKILPLFHEWERSNLKNDIVKVAAMDLGLENELFNECLLNDVWLVALGGVFVMTCIYFYTTSLFVTAMTCLAVVFSVGLAYFIYTLVFEMSFFPYMNLLAVVVIIGVGADDAFIFVKIWQCVLTERFTKSTVTTQSLSIVDAEYTETLQNLMTLTLRHASLSMFVTSLTTATAFYASYISSITAIKCFGVFAGTTIITNYLLMVTWLPASIAIMERMSVCTACNKLQLQKFILMFNKSINKLCKLFEAAIIGAVTKYAFLWLTTFFFIGMCSAIIVLHYPGLQLPEKNHFQLFVSNHPFEVYNTKFKNEFWFEKSLSSYENFKLPLRFVWGIRPVDDGDNTNPYSHGSIYYDNNFNVTTRAAQEWLFNFCKHLRQQPFYQLTFGMLLPNCFIENFMTFMERICIDGMDGTDRTPCCDISKFPYEPHVFEYCLPKSISSLYSTPREFFMPGVAGPKFFAGNHQAYESSSNDSDENSTYSFAQHSPPVVKALVIEFESNVSFTTVYADVKSFVDQVELWFAEELRSAPTEMQGGWFTSELKFFDVQDTLARDTVFAIGIAMSASLIVVLMVTMNVLISLYAVVTVTFTIFTTVATLIMMGWKLNVLESITVSTAIGLAVDFSLHFGIHYRLSPSSERIAATHFALSRIIGPTIMAALTTGLAGAIMLASSVLPYIQIGMFLVVVTSVSWLYATFFLMSLLKVGGPQYGFMQFNLPRVRKRPAANPIKYYDRKQSQVIATEQLLTPSSSAIGDLIHSETHELESLPTNSLIKTISGADASNALSLCDFEHPFRGVHTSAVKAHHHGCGNYNNPSSEAATVPLPVTTKNANNFYKI